MRKVAFIFLFFLSGLVLSKVIIDAKAGSFCANSISCIKNLSEHTENGATGIYNGQKIKAPNIDIAQNANGSKVLGDQTAVGDKHIFVDLTNQTLYAYQGNTLFMQVLISSGKWHPTPTGDFTIWSKLRATRMTGGTGEDFYDLPNVPYTMFFSGSGVPESAGFALHGAYWHDNFGHPMSHGCINMRTIDAQKLFNWVDDPSVSSTTITIYGEANI